MQSPIEKLGFDPGVHNQIDPAQSEGYTIARVLTVDKDNYTISNGETDVRAEITGKLMFCAESPLDFPATGDWVAAQYHDNGSFAIIHEIIPRKSLLKRKTSGRRIAYQPIAANIDTGLIVQALDTNFNPRRLERYLVMLNEARIHPFVLLSKSDLLSADEKEKKAAEIRTLNPGLQIAAFSNHDPGGLAHVENMFIPCKTYCLLGSSGVGKTTLINRLLGEERLKTRDIREKDGKGRHATTRRQLIRLKNGALVIDTPGMRELGNIGAGAGIESTFDEIAELSGQCRYKDCSHTQEQGCAVLAALHKGLLSRKRYDNYIKLTKESAFHEMSYLEKKRKDKKFGKHVKSVMKEKKNRR